MTANDDFIGLLEDYLDTFDGGTPLPDRVRAAVHADLPSTRQVRPRPGPTRVFTMLSKASAPARWGLVAAAVVVAVILGAAFMSNANRGLTAAPAPPGPSPTATATPVSAAALPQLLTASQVTCNDEPDAAMCIKPGTYSLGSTMPVAMSLTVPAGWFEYHPGGHSAGVLVDHADVPNGSGWGVVISQVGAVYRDPCDPRAGTLPPSEVDTVEELVAVMASWPQFDAAPPEAITIDGVPGQRITLTGAPSPADCGSEYDLWQTPSVTAIDAYPVIPGEGDHEGDSAEFRILDLDGNLVAIRMMGSARTSPYELENGIPLDPDRHAADLAAQEAIVDSIRIDDGNP